MLNSMMHYEKNSSGNWIPVYKGLLTYSEQNTTNVNDIETKKIRLYPNPVSEHLSFSFSVNSNFAVFELFDSLGRKLVSQKINNHEQLNLDYLSKGLYLYNLDFDGIKQSGKLLKE
jgi:hypothetical protein